MRLNPRARSCLILVPLALGLPGCLGATADGPSAPVERLGQQRFPRAVQDPTPRVERAYFEGGLPRWDSRSLSGAGIDACGGSDAERQPRARLARPLVVERRCPDPRQPGRARRSLVGFDAQTRPVWERPLVFRSNEVEIEQWLIGATPRALVLSSLEVWSPASGETLEPAPVHQAAGRPVPDHHFSTSALYLPATREWLAFEAEVTLVRRTGGIHRVDRAAGRRLWSPVSATLLGTYDRVEAMAPGADGRFALLALRQETRGPSSVAVAVLDARTGERLFEERHGSGRTCSEPDVVPGDGGHFAFSYRDDAAAENVLVHYRVRP